MRVLKVSVYLQAMKNIFYTIICCLISLTSLAQSDFGYGNPDGIDPQDEGMQRDSTKEQRYVPHYRLTWKWVHDGVYQKFYQLDTLQDGLQNTNLIFKHSVSNTYLGNFPAPYVSDIYILRPQGEDFLPQDRLRDYFFKPEDALEYNTTTPFTQLSYFNGGGGEKRKTGWMYGTSRISAPIGMPDSGITSFHRTEPILTRNQKHTISHSSVRTKKTAWPYPCLSTRIWHISPKMVVSKT